MRLLLLGALLLGSSSLARGYEGYIQLRVCLDAHAPCPGGQPDLLVSEHRLEARFGLRTDPGSAPTDALAVRLDAAYLVRNHLGQEYRVWVRPPRGALLRIDVEPAEQRTRRLTGRFLTATVQVEGLSSSGSFGVLSLRDDGRYTLNSGSGHFWLRDGLVFFDGAIAHWGPARVSVDDARLTFEFERGLVRWVIGFERSADAPRAAPIAAR